MGKFKVPYLEERERADGSVAYFWIPKSTYRKQGWKLRGPWTSLDVAVRECEAANAELRAWRKGEASPTVADADAQTRPKITLAPRDPRPAPGTLARVIADYRASAYFLDRAPKTRKFYAGYLDMLDAWGGDKDVDALTPRVIRKGLYEPFASDQPYKATALVRTLSACLGVRHLIYDKGQVGWSTVDANPCRELRLSSLPKGTGRLWPAYAVDMFVEAADRIGLHSVGTGILVNYWLGQRQNDLLALPRDPVRDGVFRFRQNKKDREVILDATLVPALVARIADERERLRDRAIATNRLIVCERDNQIYKPDRFTRAVAEVREIVMAEWPAFDPNPIDPIEDPIITAQMQFRHLRHTAVTKQIEAGVDVPSIASITGHSINTVHQILEHYKIHTAAITRNAFARRVEYENEEGLNG